MNTYDNIEVFPDKAHGWRFRVKAANGEILAQSEAYTRRADAERGGETLGLSFANSIVHDFMLNELSQITRLVKEKREGGDIAVARELAKIGEYLVVRLKKLQREGLQERPEK